MGLAFAGIVAVSAFAALDRTPIERDVRAEVAAINMLTFHQAAVRFGVASGSHLARAAILVPKHRVAGSDGFWCCAHNP
jgi:hypothetical protein